MNKQFHNVHANMDGVFNAHSGRLIDLNRPNEAMICIEDIAAALSKICRFGGHSNTFYSVAQHSVLVAALAPEYLCREALMHDAAEAYLGHVIKPLKNMLGIAYEELEADFMKAIIRKFKLDVSKLLEVKQYDKEALSIEHATFIIGKKDVWIDKMQQVNLNPGYWLHYEANLKFMAYYKIFFQL